MGLGTAAQQRGRMHDDATLPVGSLPFFSSVPSFLCFILQIQDKEREIAEMEAWLKANVDFCRFFRFCLFFETSF